MKKEALSGLATGGENLVPVRYNQNMGQIERIGDQLASTLRALGVNFVLGRQSKAGSLQKKPARLIAALASSNEARLRLALIPLFLQHPEFAVHVRAVARKINPSVRLTLQCYYTAAVWLAQKHQEYNSSLPDLFSKDLNLTPTIEPETNLKALAERHRELSGAKINWLGTYQHAANIWLKGLELQGA